MVKIGKEYHWEMSHRLPFHNGGCYNIHGHSYKLILELTGETNPNGMLLDYYDIDKIVIPILDEYDHSLIIDSADSKVINAIKELGFKYKIIETTSTSENLSKHFIDRFGKEFSKFSNISSITLRLYETADAYAEISMELR